MILGTARDAEFTRVVERLVGAMVEPLDTHALRGRRRGWRRWKGGERTSVPCSGVSYVGLHLRQAVRGGPARDRGQVG